MAYDGTVLVRDPEDYHPDGEPFPDIAFIEPTSSLDHQIVNQAGDEAPLAYGHLAVLGYSRVTPEKGVPGVADIVLKRA